MSPVSFSTTSAGVSVPSAAPHAGGQPRVPPPTMFRSICSRWAARGAGPPTMKRPLVVVLALAAACGPAARNELEGRKVREKMPGQTDPAIRAKHLVERFPGVERVDFVQLLAWVEPRRGPCWSELSPVHRTPVTMRYSLRGWNPIAEPERAEGLEELLARGWTRIYRAPPGEGVEHRAPFAALDLSYGPELRCRCAGVGDAVEEAKSDVSLRLRWEP